MSNIGKIIEWTRNTSPSALPYNVIGIGWGPKVKDGVETGEYAVIFTVQQKMSLEDIPEGLKIPKELNIEGNVVVTDVAEPAIHSRLIDDCHSGQPTLYNPAEPVLSHRKKYRPLKGGTSSILVGSSDATLGILVRDKTDGQIVALSNTHVYGASQLISGLQTRNANEVGTTSVLEISARQPASISFNPFGGSVQDDYIGKCKRSVLVGDESSNIIGYLFGHPIVQGTSCDAAIVQLSSYDMIDSTSGDIVNFTQAAPYEFASDAEIDSLLDPGSPNFGAPIFRGGRTCGPVGFPGYTNSCNLSVYQFDVALVGLYSGHYSFFTDNLWVRGDVVPVRGGDSGSAVFALFNQNNPSLSAWKVVGLVFAGPSTAFPEYGICSRITKVANNLGIIPWDTTTPLLSSSTRTITNNTNTPTASLSGRVFYQTGWQI